MHRLRALALIGWLVACAPAETASPPEIAGEATQTIHVIRHGWHTGIIIARGDLQPGLIPELDDFPHALHIEFGWGDRDYYPALEPTFGMALAAAFVPSPSVMRLRGLSQPPAAAYRQAELVEIALTTSALARLVAGLAADFERPDGARASIVASHPFSASNFYPAHGEFHIFNTCNTWTARKLASAGLKVSPSGVITADHLMERVRAIAP